MRPSALVNNLGGRYSKELGIDLSRGKSGEVYKWFLASILFGARISELIAEKAYREFRRERLLSPQKMLDAGWDKLVEILDRAGYVRYDFKTATKLMNVNRALMQQYQGDLNALHASAKDDVDLEQHLRELGKGIGHITINIFLRELRDDIWPLATPLPTERVIQAAKELGFIQKDMHDRARILEALKSEWHEDGMPPKEFADFEAALVRYGTSFHRKAKPRFVAHQSIH